MFLIVGLGNPGKQYDLTRHNVGFMAVDILSDRHNALWSFNSKFDAEIASCVIDHQKIILCKPSTFMNLSGKSVLAMMSFYKIAPGSMIVIHDDIDIDLGKVKYKIGGSNAGHRGLRSIDQSVGKEYHRVRIGVGRPEDDRMDVADFVLSRFKVSEQQIVLDNIESIVGNISLLMDGEIEEFKKALGV